MKLNYSQLNIHLAKTLLPIYLVTGDEWQLKQDAIKLIIKTARKIDFQDYLIINIDNHNWDQMYTILHSNSLMAEKRLIHCKLHEMPNKLGNEIIANYAKQSRTDILLLIESEKIDNKTNKASWISAIEKIGCIITIWPLSKEQLPKWLIERAKKYKLTLNQEAANLLTHYVEGNLSAASQFLEKLYLLQPNSPIDAAIIHYLANENPSFNIFDLTDSMIARNKERTLYILNHLKLENIEPTLILWNITRELRILIELGKELSKGIKWQVLLEKYKIFSYRQSAVRQFLNQYSVYDCIKLLGQAAEIDRIIKGATSVDIWQILPLFCLKMIDKAYN